MLDNVLNDIISIVKKYNVQKVVLFGSRARGDNTDVSDYDIAVFEDKLTATDKAYFTQDIEDIQTLKKIDIVFATGNETDELMNSIKKEGVTIYEQT
jgi:predicted nucleotidyltransferase